MPERQGPPPWCVRLTSGTVGVFWVDIAWPRNWFVLQAAPQRELPLVKLLKAHGLQSYVPQFPLPKRAKPESVRSSRPRLVFPGYVFFKVPAGFKDWADVLWAGGVRRILWQEGGPALIDDAVIDHLKDRLAAGKLVPVRPTLLAGQPVLIERGPLAAVDAIFDKHLDADSRVQVLGEMMGRRVRVQVDLRDLQQPAG
jgi:transcription antitermination factor NusG